MSKQFITITENRMGHLHIWPGRKHVSTFEPLNHKVNGKESAVYVQDGESIAHYKSFLSKAQIKSLEGGWTVVTNKIPTEYFEYEFELWEGAQQNIIIKF